MRYLIYDIDKHQDSPQLAEVPTSVDFENADECYNVIVDLQEGQRYFCGAWKPCTMRSENAGVDVVRGWLEKGSTWQARALHAEKRLALAYERARELDSEITRLKMEKATANG